MKRKKIPLFSSKKLIKKIKKSPIDVGLLNAEESGKIWFYYIARSCMEKYMNN